MEREPHAEDEFVREYARGVFFVLRRETRDQQIVDDLFQETFRIAIEKVRRGDLRDPSKLSSFLASTARFVAIDYFRREAKHDNNSDIEDTEVAIPEQGQLDDLIYKEHAQLVRGVIDELKSERDRAILFRFYIAQDDKSDICRDLELSALHFNRVLHRAKQRYKALFLEATGQSV